MLRLKKEDKVFLIAIVSLIALSLAISFIVKKRNFTCPLVNLVKSKIASNKSIPININKATVEELTLIKGIGEVLASRIIDYRNKQGDFKSIEELKNVKGIGEHKLNRIKNEIILE